MVKQLYFEDVKIGDEVPATIMEKTQEELAARERKSVGAVDRVELYDVVKWCGSVDEYVDFHYDEGYTKSIGLPGMMVPGQLLGAYMMTALSNWAGEWGNWRKISYRNIMMTHPGDAAIFKAKVTKKYSQDKENFVELEIVLENQNQQVTNSGTTIVTLPTKPIK